jgi:hypothetical protein
MGTTNRIVLVSGLHEQEAEVTAELDIHNEKGKSRWTTLVYLCISKISILFLSIDSSAQDQR